MYLRRTSLDAYHSLKDSGALSSLRWAVYDALFNHGPMTRNELDALLRGPDAINASYSRRLTELERMGLACRPFTKTCKHSGRECDAWDVTDRVHPLPADRQKTRLQIARERCRELEELCEEIAIWLEPKNPKAAERIRVRVAEAGPE